MQAERIGFELANWLSMFSDSLNEPGYLIERFIRVAIPIFSCSAGATSELPLRFGGQSITDRSSANGSQRSVFRQSVKLRAVLAVAKLVAKLCGFYPGHHFNRLSVDEVRFALVAFLANAKKAGLSSMIDR